MIKLADLLDKLKIKAKQTEREPSSNAIKVVRNWYEERYEQMIVQRNWLLLMLLFVVALIIVAVMVVAEVTNSREFDPFVIQIDEKSGSAKIVNPVAAEILQGDDALARYFIKKYVIARETYNPVDFETTARQTVRLLSSNNIYWQYLGYIKNKATDPTILYGQKNTTFLVVRSWSKLDTKIDGRKSYILRFSLNETMGEKNVYNKIAVVEFNYVPMELTEEERDVNPVGFQITGYRVDDDNS